VASLAASSADAESVGKVTSMLVEGWRGVSHSFSLTSQYYMLELLKLAELRLFHHDLPFLNKQWNRIDNSADFDPEAQHQIDALPPAGDTRIDCVYRISTPIFAGADDDQRRTLTYMVTEFGLTANILAVEPARYAFFTRDANIIVTPTRWSRDRVIEFGFPADQVKIVPSGVDAAIFHPLGATERIASRAQLGIDEDETVFVNVGGAFWNKGVDLLVRAFAKLHSNGRKVRLIVKDQSALYGRSLGQTVQRVIETNPELFSAGALAAISVISGNLNQGQLRTLYGIADWYVSPYRAEGFNLPVLEAIACGTPVIVTDGGSTDDFCPDGVAWRIPGHLCARDDLRWLVRWKALLSGGRSMRLLSSLRERVFWTPLVGSGLPVVWQTSRSAGRPPPLSPVSRSTSTAKSP
jgi:glycosyltransferase involved in cell wall biosynthesis